MPTLTRPTHSHIVNKSTGGVNPCRQNNVVDHHLKPHWCVSQPPDHPLKAEQAVMCYKTYLVVTLGLNWYVVKSRFQIHYRPTVM